MTKNLNIISFILQTRKSRVLIIELEILANVHSSHSTYLVYMLNALRRQKVQQPHRKIAPFWDLGELCVV